MGSFNDWVNRRDEGIFAGVRRAVTGGVDEQRINDLAQSYATQLGIALSPALVQVARAKLVGGQQTQISKKAVMDIYNDMPRAARQKYPSPWSLLISLDDQIAKKMGLQTLPSASEDFTHGWQVESGFADWDKQVQQVGGYDAWLQMQNYQQQANIHQAKGQARLARDAARQGLTPQQLQRQRMQGRNNPLQNMSPKDAKSKIAQLQALRASASPKMQRDIDKKIIDLTMLL